MPQRCFIRPLHYLQQRANDPSLSEAQRLSAKRDSALTEKLQAEEEAAWKAADKWRKARLAAGEPTFGYAPVMQPPDVGQLPKSLKPEFRCQIWDAGQSLNLAHPVTGTIKYSSFEWPEGQNWDERQGDGDCETAVANFKAVYEMIGQLSTRDSYDGGGSSFVGCIHVGHPSGAVYNNAFWDPSLQRMYFGEYQTRMPDTVGHEMMHGITNTSVDLRTAFFSGALNESISDCFGSMVRQWTIPVGQHGRTIDSADWCIWNPDENGDIKEKLRSLEKPGEFGHPGHMDDLDRKDKSDVYGIHSKCGIPNHAFYLACKALAGTYPYSWDRVGVVWFHTVIDGFLRNDSNFEHFAYMTLAVSRKIYSQEPQIEAAISDAWGKVGIKPSNQIAKGVSKYKAILEKRVTTNKIVWGNGDEDDDFKSALIVALRSIGPNNTEFGVYYKDTDSNYIWKNLSTALGLVPSEYITTFDVVQDKDLETYMVCASAYSNNDQKGRLFVWKPFIADGIDWDDKNKIQSLIIPQIPTLPSPVVKVLLGPLDSNAAYTYAPIILGLQKTIARVEVKPDLGSWVIASDLNLPTNATRVADLSCGAVAGSSGVFVLYEVDDKQQLLYTAYSRLFDTPIKIPDGIRLTSVATVVKPGSQDLDELIAGGNGLWSLPGDAIGRSSAALQQIGKGLSVTALRTVQVIPKQYQSPPQDAEREVPSGVLILDQNGNLYKMAKGPGASDPRQVKKITDGIQNFDLCSGETEDGMTFPLITTDIKGDFNYVNLGKKEKYWVKRPFY
ncbi:Translation initiation factor 3 subunit b [Orbilia blumenaviensis]|uniref:Translation initiation factor 3 subunit b n=1 Tax=Orbilia blumenaviensis TaxID=1796055 RepID=A0AAV9UMP2_9PEZI